MSEGKQRPRFLRFLSSWIFYPLQLGTHLREIKLDATCCGLFWGLFAKKYTPYNGYCIPFNVYPPFNVYLFIFICTPYSIYITSHSFPLITFWKWIDSQRFAATRFQGLWREAVIHGCGRYTWPDGRTFLGRRKRYNLKPTPASPEICRCSQNGLIRT